MRDAINPSKKRLLVLMLGIQVSMLSERISGPGRRPYKVKVRRTMPYEPLVREVGRLRNNIKFEIRAAERHHNVAHFHVTIRGGGSGSYRIDNLSALESDIAGAREKEILAWAAENQQLLKDIWNEFHGERITVS